VTSGNNSQETFQFSGEIVDTPNSAALALFSDGSRDQPDSIDYVNDEFSYTDGGNAEDLDAYYVVRGPNQITIEKSAPAGQGSVSEVLHDDVTSLLHERDQNQDPPVPSFQHKLHPVVPRNYTIDVYSDGPAALAYNDAANGTTATNAILRIPINRANERVKGLNQAVKKSIAERV